MKIKLSSTKKRIKKFTEIQLKKFHQALLLNRHKQFQQKVSQLNSSQYKNIILENYLEF